MANWNPHVHALITDTCWDREGNCCVVPEMDTTDILPYIPKKGAKQVIYYGAYSQAWRGRERRQGILPTAAATEEESTTSGNTSLH